LKNSDFFYFAYKILFFSYLAPPPPHRKSVKILPAPGNIWNDVFEEGG